jgi:hypothetical protein
MRSVQLQATLSEYIDLAAAHLQAEVAAGAEVPFELEQRSGRRRAGGPALYCYRPLTGQFIAERMTALERLPGYAEAAERLGAFDGLGRYLANVGGEVAGRGPRAEAAAAISALLCEIFAEQTDFEPLPERVRAALERLESTALSSTSEVTLVARLAGLTITSPELALTRGLTIAQPHALEGLPPGAVDGEPGGHLVVVLAVEQDDPRAAVARGREILKDLLRALRLFGDGRVTLGALAWGRVGSGQWTPLALGAGGRPRGMLVVTAEQEDELRAFCNLVSRRAPDGNELAWALRRFELGSEREDPHEALSDHLLALRALLEPEGPASGLLPGRLAALCATPARRLELTERTLQALALERAAIAGTGPRHAGSEALIADTADHLRALLRDVICGHLDPDLVTLADEILLEAEAEAEEEEGAEVEVAPAGAAAAEVQAQAEIAEVEAELEPPEPIATEPRARRRIRTARAGELSEEIFGDPREAEEILDVFI